jgi:hypothetical protein
VRPLNSEFVFAVTLKVPSALDLGQISTGGRRITTISGGEFTGPAVNGRVLSGNDWLLMRQDGVLQMDARVMLETSDGKPFAMNYTGFRHGPKDVLDRLGRGEEVDPSLYYFRITPVFEVSVPALDWMNRSIFSATGTRSASGPTYYIYAIR